MFLNMESVVSTIFDTLMNSVSLEYIKWNKTNPDRVKKMNAPIFVGFVEPANPIRPIDNKIGFSLNLAGVKITVRKYTSKPDVIGVNTIYDMENDVKNVLYHNLHNGYFSRHFEPEFISQGYRMSGDTNEFSMIYQVAIEVPN